MNKINFDQEMQKLIETVSGLDQKPKLLMHACCAPCASAVVERLKDVFNITLYFYNPNLDSEKEYALRANELKRLANHFDVNYIIEDYCKEDFLQGVKGLELQPEGGLRCKECFSLRLLTTAKKAKQDGYEYFGTTLTISPLKNATLLNEIGLMLSESQGVKYLVSDFKKKNGYIRSIELSKKLSLYRQNYCGCAFSKREN